MRKDDVEDDDDLEDEDFGDVDEHSEIHNPQTFEPSAEKMNAENRFNGNLSIHAQN